MKATDVSGFSCSHGNLRTNTLHHQCLSAHDSSCVYIFMEPGKFCVNNTHDSLVWALPVFFCGEEKEDFVFVYNKDLIQSKDCLFLPFDLVIIDFFYLLGIEFPLISPMIPFFFLRPLLKLSSLHLCCFSSSHSDSHSNQSMCLQRTHSYCHFLLPLILRLVPILKSIATGCWLPCQQRGKKEDNSYPTSAWAGGEEAHLFAYETAEFETSREAQIRQQLADSNILIKYCILLLGVIFQIKMKSGSFLQVKGVNKSCLIQNMFSLG